MIGIIVARSKNNVIGQNGKIPWNIPGEQKQFKEFTTNNVVIMGRKTYEDIGHPLKDRINIVITSKNTLSNANKDVIVCHSLQEALTYARKNYIDLTTWVIGGHRVFKDALPYVDRLYITDIDMYVEPNEDTVYFPDFDKTEFKKLVLETKGLYIRSVYIKKED